MLVYICISETSEMAATISEHFFLILEDFHWVMINDHQKLTKSETFGIEGSSSDFIFSIMNLSKTVNIPWRMSKIWLSSEWESFIDWFKKSPGNDTPHLIIFDVPLWVADTMEWMSVNRW